MVRPDAVIFCISQQHLSAGRQRALDEALTAASPMPAILVRLEGTGPHLGDALDGLVAAGHRAILVQPLGLPFSQSLAAWLPGVLAHWLEQRASDDIAIWLRPDQAVSVDAVRGIVADVLARTGDATPITGQRPSLGKPGWDQPPPFRHHLLVCTGPRCHFRGAANLKLALTASLAEAGHGADCLVATTGCLYPCNQGPLLAAYPLGEWYRLRDQTEVDRFVHTVIGNSQPATDLIVHRVAPLDAKAPPSGDQQ